MTSYYGRYKLSDTRLQHVIEFIRGDHITTTTVQLAKDLVVRLHKEPDGRMTIEVKESP